MKFVKPGSYQGMVVSSRCGLGLGRSPMNSWSSCTIFKLAGSTFALAFESFQLLPGSW